MKKLTVLMLVITAILFVDYFVISLVGIFAHMCEASCSFYENIYGNLSLGIIAVSLFGGLVFYMRKTYKLS